MPHLILLLLATAALAGADPAFAFAIQTGNPGTSASDQFTLPLHSAASYRFTIDWGDHAIESVSTADSPTHTYPAPGTYVVRITEDVAGGFPRIFFNDGGDRLKLLRIEHWGEVTWTSMAAAFAGCGNLVITADDAASARTGRVTDFSRAWAGCGGLTSFPRIDTSAGTDFSGAWAWCGSLADFPPIDTSNGTNFYGAWAWCVYLKAFPRLDTARGTVFNSAWYRCDDLAGFPLIDTGNGTDFQCAWYGCRGLTTFPRLDTRKGTDFSGAWSGCHRLAGFPLLDTGAGIEFDGAWSDCYALTDFPPLDTANGTDFVLSWGGCSGLTSFPSLDTGRGTRFAGTWENCSGLTTFPALDLGGMSDGSNCFTGVELDPASYSALLVGLAERNAHHGVVFDGGSSRYASGAADSRNAILVRDRGWTISDGGAVATNAGAGGDGSGSPGGSCGAGVAGGCLVAMLGLHGCGRGRRRRQGR